MTAADRPSVTDNARAEAQRRYQGDWDSYHGEPVDDWGFSEAERRAFMAGAEWAAGRAETVGNDGLTDTEREEYARQYRAGVFQSIQTPLGDPAEDVQDAAEDVIATVRDSYPRTSDDAPSSEVAQALADAGLLATARTRPTREQVSAAIGDAANPTQVGFGVVSIAAAVDAVHALLGGDRICEEENLMTITDFLLARIAEDEAEADRVLYDLGAGDLDSLTEKMLAECQAKRAIIEAHPVETKWMFYGVDGGEPYCAAESDPDGIMAAGQPFPCPTIRHLAAVYSDHPDYRQEWRP